MGIIGMYESIPSVICTPLLDSCCSVFMCFTFSEYVLIVCSFVIVFMSLFFSGLWSARAYCVSNIFSACLFCCLSSLLKYLNGLILPVVLCWWHIILLLLVPEH